MSLSERAKYWKRSSHVAISKTNKDPAIGTTNNSDGFARKLYKILEDPENVSIARWGDEGDSSMVLEIGQFVDHVLSKAFKHNNFASFVRQLNKYGFRKIRRGNGQLGYSRVSEFRHPSFRMNDKDALENIIRKRDTQPRSKLALEKTSSTHQTEAFDTWLAMTQQELRELRKRCNELCMHNSDLVRELLNLRSTMSHLGYVSCDKLSFPDSGNAQMGHKSPLVDPCGRSSGNGTADCASLEELPEADQLLETEEGMPSASQQHMSESLCEANAEHTFTSTQLEQLMELSMHAQATGTRTTPSPINSERRASMRALPSAVLSSTSKSHDHSDCVEYANGETRGTEEMRSYAISDASYVESLTPQRPALRDTRDQKELSQVDPDWTRRPQILLVEDDRKCRKIGGVLLDALRCNVEFAQDGLQAVTKVSAGAMYDLVLMGTAMPHLDGVSATHYIRRFNHTPIIAMASSLDDGHLAMYSEHGMSDVLQKPFTWGDLLSMLRKHLGHLRKDTRST